MRILTLAAVLAATAVASGALAADRYGATERAAPAPASTGAPAAQPYAPRPMLSWSGKSQPMAAAEPTALQTNARPAPMPLPPPRGEWRRPTPGALSAQPATLAAAPAQQQQAYGPAPPQVPAQAGYVSQYAPPTSLYGRPAQPAPAQTQAAPAPRAAAQPGPYSGGSRFYSVHREYGVAPDPIPAPLAQPFFNGATADLAEPPPPVDPRTPQQQRAAAAQADSGVANARPGSQGGDWGAGDDPGLNASAASGGHP